MYLDHATYAHIIDIYYNTRDRMELPIQPCSISLLKWIGLSFTFTVSAIIMQFTYLPNLYWL